MILEHAVNLVDMAWLNLIPEALLQELPKDDQGERYDHDANYDQDDGHGWELVVFSSFARFLKNSIYLLVKR